MRVNNLKIKVFNKLFLVFSFCFLISAALIIFVTGIERNARKTDLVSFITGAKIISSGKAGFLYDLDTQQSYQDIVTAPYKLKLIPYRNPPVLAFFHIPISFMPLNSAYKVYTLVLLSITVIVSWLSKKAFVNTGKSFWFVLPFIFFPSFVAIYSGQNSTSLILTFILIYYFLRKKTYFITGIITGLLFMKFQYLVIFPYLYFLIKNKKRFLIGFLVSSTLVILGSLYIFGLGFFREYLTMLIATENPVYSTRSETMFTLFSSLTQITSLAKHDLFWINFIIYSLSVLYFYKNYMKFSLEINFAVLSFLTLTFCVHGGNIDIALLIVPLLLLIDVYRGSKKHYLENILVIFIVIFSTLLFGFKLSFMFPFHFLLSVALLFKKNKKQFAKI